MLGNGPEGPVEPMDLRGGHDGGGFAQRAEPGGEVGLKGVCDGLRRGSERLHGPSVRVLSPVCGTKGRNLRVPFTSAFVSRSVRLAS